jgi:hypothetical protein
MHTTDVKTISIPVHVPKLDEVLRLLEIAAKVDREPGLSIRAKLQRMERLTGIVERTWDRGDC